MCVCVCVCVCEREREREEIRSKKRGLIHRVMQKRDSEIESVRAGRCHTLFKAAAYYFPLERAAQVRIPRRDTA